MQTLSYRFLDFVFGFLPDAGGKLAYNGRIGRKDEAVVDALALLPAMADIQESLIYRMLQHELARRRADAAPAEQPAGTRLVRSSDGHILSLEQHLSLFAQGLLHKPVNRFGGIEFSSFSILLIFGPTEVSCSGPARGQSLRRQKTI